MTQLDATIVIPVRNGAEHLVAAIDQALAAATADTEIVVVDDASNDATLSIARALQRRHPSVRVVRTPASAGVAAARELGAAHARGRFVWFVDVDDRWPADALRTLLAAAHNADAAIVVAQAEYLTPAGRIKPVEGFRAPTVLDGRAAFSRFLRDDITGFLWNKLIARELLASVTFARTTVHSDQALVAQLLGRAASVALVPAVVYRYVQRPGSLVRAGRPKHASLRAVQEITHEVAAEVDRDGALRDGLDHYDLRSIVLPSAEDLLSPGLDARGRAEIRRRTRDEAHPERIAAARRRGDRRTWALGLAARHAPPLYELYLRLQRRRARIGRA
ncbi:glycosyltransferase family 2 protein [Microbacterium sp. No. 7]|uniref:glycosyltransferase family 2 protein n=1 Tax=Microbacterium sp. No. 7 TaxID=1714373 RepID=UPI0006CFA45B|nr:glycosyltransferase family A protein [Microbacterium sp. No. 7]ALJ19086.1 hypothetical protein AOA12_03870 [Microbacterium sp. No. 7]